MNARMEQIYTWICENGAHTEREIADGVGLRKTPYTRAILFWLIAEGYIARTWDELRVPKGYVYFKNDVQKLPWNG